MTTPSLCRLYYQPLFKDSIKPRASSKCRFCNIQKNQCQSKHYLLQHVNCKWFVRGTVALVNALTPDWGYCVVFFARCKSPAAI